VIHYCENDDATDRSLLPLGCELLDSDLLSSMMDAFEQRSSDDSDAHSTLLLLNVDMLSPDAQVTLADFLAKRTHLQVLATSSRPLSELVADELICLRLVSILSTMTIVVPPLSARIDDIPLLLQCAIEQQNAMGGKQVSRVTPAALEQLASYSWPGDIAELFELIGEAHAHADGIAIDVDDLPERIKLARDAEMYPPREIEKIELDQFMAKIETELVLRALNQSKGNKSQAAELLGINRARLLRRIEQLGIGGNE
jgi:DNA-binding NtrC family response regulator